MKHGCSYIIPPLVLGLSLISRIASAQLPPPDQQQARASTTPEQSVPGLPPSSYLEAHRGQTDPQTVLVRRKIYAAQRAPELPALIALSSDDTALRDVAYALSADQCRNAFLQAMLKGGCWPVANAVLEPLIEHKAADQFAKIARWLTDPSNHFPQPSDARMFARNLTVEWCHSNPRAAADFAATVPLDKEEAGDPFSLSHVLVDVCGDWANKDPVAAWGWAEALADADPHKVDALVGSMSVIDEFHPDKAKVWVARLSGVNKQTPKLAETVAGRLARLELQTAKRPSSTLQWALSISGAPARGTALRGVIDAWVPSGGEESIAQAKQWAATLPPDEVRGATWGALAVACQSWADRMVELAGGSPEFFRQFKENGEIADDWLGSLPAGSDRDEATTIRKKFETSILDRKVWR